MRSPLQIAAITLLTLASFACSSSTKIHSTDPEARIYVNGELRGKGEATHSDTNFLGATQSVRIERDGCAPQFFEFKRNEEFDIGPGIAGCLCLFPWAWLFKYKSERTYEYKCAKPGSTSAPSS